VVQLRDRISLYTNRTVSKEYASIKKGDSYIDFGDFPPQDIVAAFVPQEKQEMVFATHLRSMDWDKWRTLVGLLAKDRHRTDEKQMAGLLDYRAKKDGDVVLPAIKNNLVPPIVRLHRTGATLSQNIIQELKLGRIVIIDTSLLSSEDALSISGMTLHRIFSHNRRHFTDAAGSVVRCLAVMEEAQTVLGDRQLDDRNIFVRWVKEGRKYGLGSVMVTQQPGAISDQIISQGDNFFVLHLLNDSDLRTLNRHNAYFSEDILSFIRNEPIRGNCFFWSAPDQPFVLPARVADFVSVTDHSVPTKPEDQAAAAPRKPLQEQIKQWAISAIAGDVDVWLYTLDAMPDRKDWMVFAHDYLATAVAKRLHAKAEMLGIEDVQAFIETEFADMLRGALKALGGHQGYAVLAGNKRPVWALPDNAVKLVNSKTVKTQRVVVSRTL